MKAEELRVGNLVYFQNEILSVDPYHILCVYQGNITYTPVVLTEKILLECHAVKSYNENELHFDRFRLIWQKAYKYWYVLDFFSSFYVSKVEYLHEWQNLVFSMNGKEINTSKIYENT